MEKFSKFKDLRNNDIPNVKKLSTVFGGIAEYKNGCISDICVKNRNSLADICREAICRTNIGACVTRVEI